MPTLDEIPLGVLFCMFTGEPGTRKSTAALSFPKPMYIFDVDQKIESLIKPMLAWGINPKEVTFDPYKDFSSIENRLKSFQQSCPYKTIVLDSITSIGDVTNQQILIAKSGTTTSSGAEKGGRVGGIPINTLEDYKAESSALGSLMTKAKDICKYHKVNVVVIAHVVGERDIKLGSKNSYTSRTIITGGKQISGKIPAYCPEIYFFEVIRAMEENQEGTYALTTIHTGTDFARTALPLDRVIKFNNDPLYDKFLLPAINKQKEQVNQNKK